MNRLMTHNLRFNGSYKSMENMASVVNSTPNASVKIPETKYLIKKCMQPNYKHEIHIKCNRCSNYIVSLGNEAHCELCDTTIKALTSENFFYIPFEQQLLQSIQNHIDDILSYYLLVCKQEHMTDIHNSHIFANIQAKYSASILLPLIINTDGVKVFNSNQKSLWMIQAMQGWLPPSIRFYPTNIMIIASTFGAKKPNMKDFFFPFLDELRKINRKGGMQYHYKGKTYNFMPVILSCCCDLPAKADVQGMVGHSGHYGCGFCLHPGISVAGDKKAVIRYIEGSNNYGMRSHSSVVKIYEILKSEKIKGVKSMSCLVAAKYFDLIFGFSIDYMHCVLLGIVKKLMSLWLDSSNHSKPFYIKKKQQTLLSNRLIKIKPISEIMRKPRSIYSRADFKANEYRSLLYYYLYFALDGLLDAKYVKHFRSLSCAVYSLSKKTISFDSIEQAKLKLNEFADKYEILYGKSSVTINLHYLRHLAMQVEKLGPLWSQSAFAFEANNGIVVKSITSTKDILHQLTWKYVMKNRTKSVDDSEKKSYSSIGKERVIKITSNETQMIRQHGFEIKNNFLTIHNKVVIRGIKYTSQQMKEISTIDYFIKLNDDQIGSVKYYTIFNFNLFAVIDIFEVVETYDHFFQIIGSDRQELVNINDINEKCLYLKFGQREYVTCVPNKFEKA